MTTITLEVYHGGNLKLSPSMHYMGGKKEVHENYDPNHITVTDIIDFLKSSGYNDYTNIWYKFKDEDMTTISSFENDKDVLKIFDKLHTTTSTVLQIFVNHKVDDAPEEEMVVMVEDERERAHVSIEEEELDMTRCDFPDSDAEQPDLFFEQRDARVEIIEKDVNDWLGRNDAKAQGATIEGEHVIEPALDGFNWDGDVQTEYGDSDELISLNGSSSSSEDEFRRPRYPTFNERTDFNRPINLQLGMKFASHKVFREALKQYAIENGIDFKYKKNEASRITAHCKNNCGWRIHASKTQEGDAFQIKTFYYQHSCGWVRENKKVTVAWLANKYVEYARDQPDWNPTEFANQVLKDHNVVVSRNQTYRAKRKALEKIRGSHRIQFEPQNSYKCGNCGEFGHNARGCKRQIKPSRKGYKKRPKKSIEQECSQVNQDTPTMSQPPSILSTQTPNQQAFDDLAVSLLS